MKRFAHIIKDNKTLQYPSHFMFFDTETKEHQISPDEYEHKLYLGVAAYWHWRRNRNKDDIDYKVFYKDNEFWDFVLSKLHKKSSLYLIAHNISFDFKVLKGFKALKDKGFKLKKLIINGLTNIWVWSKDDKTIVCLDNMNYFRASLKQLGNDLDMPKLDMPAQKDSAQVWIKYCKRDVDILLKAWQLWLKFLRDNDLGTFGKTLASQALNAYRHRFMDTPVYIHNDKKALNIEREAYHGGRTECFFIGKLTDDEYYNLDVNSMYPYVMLSNEYPYKLKTYISKPSVEHLKQLLKKYCVIAKVAIKTPAPVYSYKYNNRLIFPTGKFYTTLTTRELDYALIHNHIVKVLYAVVYHRANLFSEYVKFFYSKRLDYRLEGNKSFAYLCKLMLNSLYGKFGQKNEVYEMIDYNPEYEDGYETQIEAKTGKILKFRCIAGRVEEFKGFTESFNSFPAIPAHITADARMLLWSYIDKAGKKNCYYCDTDSLFVNRIGYQRLKYWINDTRLGDLSVVDTADSLEIRGLKDYTFNTYNKIKGIRKDAKKLSDNTYEQLQFEGIRSALRNKRLNKMVVKKISKTIKRDYLKGQLTPSGWIKPFRFNFF